jgi:hypothetical protein
MMTFTADPVARDATNPGYNVDPGGNLQTHPGRVVDGFIGAKNGA